MSKLLHGRTDADRELAMLYSLHWLDILNPGTGVIQMPGDFIPYFLVGKKEAAEWLKSAQENGLVEPYAIPELQVESGFRITDRGKEEVAGICNPVEYAGWNQEADVFGMSESHEVRLPDMAQVLQEKYGCDMNQLDEWLCYIENKPTREIIRRDVLSAALLTEVGEFKAAIVLTAGAVEGILGEKVVTLADTDKKLRAAWCKAFGASKGGEGSGSKAKKPKDYQSGTSAGISRECTAGVSSGQASVT